MMLIVKGWKSKTFICNIIFENTNPETVNWYFMCFLFFFIILCALTKISNKTKFYSADFHVQTHLMKIMVNRQALFKSFFLTFFYANKCIFWWICIQISSEITGPIYTKLICRDTHAGSSKPLVWVFNKCKYNIKYKKK